MKLLYIGHPRSNPLEDDLFKAFDKKFNTRFYNGLTGGIEFNPDVVYIQSGALSIEELKLLKERTHALWTQWDGDYQPGGIKMVHKYQAYCDLTFLADYGTEYDFETHYMPHGVADWQFREINPDAKGIIFIGNHYDHLPGGHERYELCKQLESREDFTWIGTGGKIDHVPYKEIPDWYNKHKFAIAANVYNDGKGWIGNRALMAIAAGCCTLVREFPGVRDILNDSCQIYSDNDQVIWMLCGYEAKSPPLNPNRKVEELFIKKAKEAQQIIREKFTYDKIIENNYLPVINEKI